VTIEEMIAKTSTEHAPWFVVPANHKKYARVAALTEIVKTLSRGVKLGAPKIDESVLAEAKAQLNVKESLIESLRGRTE